MTTLVFTYSGNLAPGDTLKIDREKYRVTLNEVNVASNATGDWAVLGDTSNNITYADDEATRSLAMKIEYKNRWY